MSDGGLPTRVARDNECQLCRLLDYYPDDINEPEGVATVQREGGGTKTIHCCKRCADELWGEKGHDWTPYDKVECDGGSVPGNEVDGEVESCTACGFEADAMGVLDSGDRVYLHGSSFCYAPLQDNTGRLRPAVDQIQSHKEAESDD